MEEEIREHKLFRIPNKTWLREEIHKMCRNDNDVVITNNGLFFVDNGSKVEAKSGIFKRGNLISILKEYDNTRQYAITKLFNEIERRNNE